VPSFYDALRAAGNLLDVSIFKPSHAVADLHADGEEA